MRGAQSAEAYEASLKHFARSIELLPNQWNSYLELVELAKDQGDSVKQERYATLLGENVLAALPREDVAPLAMDVKAILTPLVFPAIRLSPYKYTGWCQNDFNVYA